MFIRPVQHTDLPRIVQLNEQAVPHVNSILLSDFEDFIESSSFFMVVEIDLKIVAFLIVLGPGQSYSSENYRFFLKHYQSFDYVDRIVVDPAYHGRNIGKRLYQFLEEQTKQERITCEVNIIPPNPVSTEFHKNLGFIEVGQHQVDAGKKSVSLMVKELISQQ